MKPILELYQLNLTPEESKQIFQVVESNGFTKDDEGLKQYVLSTLTISKRKAKRNATSEDEPKLFNEDTIAMTYDFLKDNPELVSTGKKAVLGLLKKGIFGK